MAQHIYEMLNQVQYKTEGFLCFVIPNQVLNLLQDLTISGSQF